MLNNTKYNDIHLINLLLYMSASSWIRKAGKAGSCNFPKNTANFRQNSNKQLQISDTADYGCSKFQFCPKISQNKRCQPKIL